MAATSGAPSQLPLARGWHAVTALVALLSIGIQLVLVATGHNVLTAGAIRPAAGTRIVRFFSYFTIESNILVLVTAAALASRPDRDGKVWRVLRLCALFGITVTGIVYVVALRPIVHLHGISAWTDAGLHYATPLLTVVGWAVWGPWPRVDNRTLAWSAAWPVAYLGWTVLHGALTQWYPYPFVDAHAHGYARVARNGVVVLLLMAAVAGLFLAGDRWRARRYPGSA